MKNVTVIIPVHKFDETVGQLISRAIVSVDVNKLDLMFVGPKAVLSEIEKLTNSDVTFVENEDTEFCTQVNKAVLQCVTEYFTVLEFDDILLPNWSTLLEEAGKNTVVLPLNENVELVEGKPVFRSFGNEIAWDAAFFQETEQGEINVGHITEEELKIFNGFNVTGGLIKTEDFISLGSLKPEYKVLAWYEFLMRVARAKKGIYVFPRVCYSHTILREGSYMAQIQDIVTPEEVSEKLKEILGEDKKD